MVCIVPEARYSSMLHSCRTPQTSTGRLYFLVFYFSTDAAPVAQELSERLVLLLSKSKMLDMELAEGERQLAVYTNKYNRDFTQEMLAHPSEIDGVEISDGDDISSSSASTKELMRVNKKLMHTLALNMHPDKNPGRDRSDFQLLTKAEKYVFCSHLCKYTNETQTLQGVQCINPCRLLLGWVLLLLHELW